MISAVVLARTRKEILPETLSSLSFCDETLILTNPDLADFAAQRNRGFVKAKGDWVLFVDSDEIVTPELATEIRTKIKDPNLNGLCLRRIDQFFGRLLWHGETGNFCELRLGRKGFGFWKREIHEKWLISGPTDKTENYLIHNSHPTISQFIKQLNYYTEIDAKELPKEGKQFNLARVVINPLGKFIQNYFLRLGFLDGLAGFVMAFMMSLNSLIVRVKMYDFSQNPSATR